MADRYTKLFSLPADLYAAGSPVIIAAGNLLKDSQTGETLAQLKIQSIAKKTIKAATVCIVPLDTVGKPLGETITHQYLDLCVNRDSGFGQKVPIKLPDSSTRAFSVSVTEVIFTDNSIWNDASSAWKPLRRPISLDAIGNSDLAEQFRMKYGWGCKNLLLEQQDLWYCVCGALNRREETCCHKCHRILSDLKAIGLDDLLERKEKRLAQTQLEAEQASSKYEKSREVAAIIFVIVMALIIISALVASMPH